MAKKEGTKLKKIITALVLLALSFGILWFVQRLLMKKYQVGVIEGSFTEEYYKDNVPHDVLIFGDCDAYENFSPIKMYEEYGISAYIRGSGEQYIWQSYYLLKDALRTDNPKVVVLSIHNMQNIPKNRQEVYNRMTLDGMRWSKDKVDAINASMRPEETFLSYVFPILRYHYRWNELNKNDFKYVFSKDKVSHNGYYMRCDVDPQGILPKPMPRISYKFDDYSMYYLDQIRLLCEEKGITLLLVRAPIEYGWFKQWDKNGQHLNIYGAEKLSVFFGKYLMDNYALTDYRTVPEVSKEYEKDIAFYNWMREDQLAEIEKYGKLISYGANAIEK